jgi:hypothetical protein
VAGFAHLPAVTIPVCRTRHTAWHRLLEGAGVNLVGRSVADQLSAIAVGFRVVLEDATALGEDPHDVRARLRARTEFALSLTEAVFGKSHVTDGVSLLPRSPRPRTEEGSRHCLPRPPRSMRERRQRSVALMVGMLPALAALLEAILPAGLKAEAFHLAERLRNIDPERLADGACLENRPGRQSELLRRLPELFDGHTLTLGELGHALAAGVGDLEAVANGACDV